LFTEDLIHKFGALNYYGNWNFKLKKSKVYNYQKLYCESFDNNVLHCSGVKFDLNKGYTSGHAKIKKALFVQDGYVKEQKQFFDDGVIVELIMRKDELMYVLVCNDRIYNTNFNQMYILGNYNKRYFEEAYNNYPYARMFRVKGE
jgi:undecaprenyl-diphosphooligosaccharide--protein glycosyltransferase